MINKKKIKTTIIFIFFLLAVSFAILFSWRGENNVVVNSSLLAYSGENPYEVPSLEILVDYNDGKNSQKKVTFFPSDEDQTILVEWPLKRKGFIFGGWSTNPKGAYPEYKALNELFAIKNKPKVIYALWYQEKPDITLVNNGVNGNDLSNLSSLFTRRKLTCHVYEGHDTCEVFLPSVIVPNWRLVGWSEDKYYQGKSVYEVNSVASLVPGTTLYLINYQELTVTYYANDGIQKPLIDSCIIYNHQTSCEITLKGEVFNNDEYFFNKWSIDENITYNVGATISIDHNIDLSAKWEAANYSIKMNVINATLASPASLSVKQNENANFIFNVPEGYIHEETKCNNNLLNYENGIVLKNIQNNQTCITKFKEITYELKYNCNGCLESEVALKKLLSSDQHVVMDCPYFRKGYQFLGWDINPLSETPDFLPGQIINKMAKTDGEVVVLYAIWRKTNQETTLQDKKSITVTYLLNGAEETTKEIDTCQNTECTFTAPTITRKGFEVLGWSTNPNSISGDVEVNQTFTISEDTTLYAITKKTVTIYFEANGATSVSSKSESCAYYNTQTNCMITMPTILRTGSYEMNNFKPAQTIQAKEIEQNNYTCPDGGTLLGSTCIGTNITNQYQKNLSCINFMISEGGLRWADDYSEFDACGPNHTLIDEKCITVFENGACTQIDDIGNVRTETCTANCSWNGDYQAVKAKTKIYKCPQGYTLNGDTCYKCGPQESLEASMCTEKKNIRWQIMGWHQNANSQSSSVKPNAKLIVNNNETYYAITKLDVTVLFNANNNYGQSLNCSYYNDEPGCEIIAPKSLNNTEIYGWQTKTSDPDVWKVGTARLFSTASHIYYPKIIEQTTVHINKISSPTYTGSLLVDKDVKGIASISVDNGIVTNYELANGMINYTIKSGFLLLKSNYFLHSYPAQSKLAKINEEGLYSCSVGEALAGDRCYSCFTGHTLNVSSLNCDYKKYSYSYNYDYLLTITYYR